MLWLFVISVNNIRNSDVCTSITSFISGFNVVALRCQTRCASDVPRSPWDFPSQLAEYIWLQIDTFESKRDLNIGQVTAVLKKPNLTRCNQRSPIKGAIPPATLPHVLCCILISCRLYGAVCSFRALFAGPARSFTVLIHCHSRQPFRHHQQQQQQEKKKKSHLKLTVHSLHNMACER